MKNENNRIILTIELPSGVVEKRELASLFNAENGRTYAALLPLDDNGDVVSNSNIELVRAKKYENEEGELDFIIENIYNEVELATAKEAFDKLLVIEENVESEPTISDLPSITFENNEGQLIEWKVAYIFKYKNRDYVGLIPMTDENIGGNINLHLMRISFIKEGELEGCEVTAIPSDMEYEEVAKVLSEQVDAESVEIRY